MKRVILIAVLASVAWAGVYEQKLALKERADAIGVQLDQLGIREQVLQMGPRRVEMPQELLQDILLLVDDYRALNTGRPTARALIQATETEPNDSFATADSFTSADVYNAEIIGGDPEDWFKLNSPTSSSIIMFEMTDSAGFTGFSGASASAVELYGPDSVNYLSQGPGGHRISGVTGLAGEWRLRVVPDGSSTGSGTTVDPYLLWGAACDATATGISLPAPGATAQHTFTADTGDSVLAAVLVDADPGVTAYDLDLEVFDPSAVSVGTSVSTATNFEAGMFHNLPASGTYTLEVLAFDLVGTPAPYLLCIDLSGLQVPTLSTLGFIVLFAGFAMIALYMARKQRNAAV